MIVSIKLVIEHENTEDSRIRTTTDTTMWVLPDIKELKEDKGILGEILRGEGGE